MNRQPRASGSLLWRRWERFVSSAPTSPPTTAAGEHTQQARLLQTPAREPLGAPRTGSRSPSGVARSRQPDDSHVCRRRRLGARSTLSPHVRAWAWARPRARVVNSSRSLGHLPAAGSGGTRRVYLLFLCLLSRRRRSVGCSFFLFALPSPPSSLPDYGQRDAPPAPAAAAAAADDGRWDGGPASAAGHGRNARGRHHACWGDSA